MQLKYMNNIRKVDKNAYWNRYKE